MKRIFFSNILIAIVAIILSITGALVPPTTAAETRSGFADSVSGQLLPLLQARGAILIDADTGKPIFSVNAEGRLYPASTTKILTALLAIEEGDLDEKVTVGDEIFQSPPDSSRAHLLKGQVLPLRDLIYALILPSGNDAALTIAVHIARKTNPDKQLSISQALDEFSRQMNDRAQQLGARSSHFSNPHGCPREDHYSTPADLAIIARQAMSNAFFRQVVGTVSYPRVKSQQQSSPGDWSNSNELLQPNKYYYLPEATGIKTGHTEQAGYCLVSAATRGNAHLLAVVLDSTREGVYMDSVYLLKYGFLHYPVHNSGVAEKDDDRDSPYAKNASTVYGIVLLCGGVYIATRRLAGR